MIKLVANKTIIGPDGLTYNRGDIWEQEFSQYQPEPPWNNGDWNYMTIPDPAKSDIYIVELDHDTGQIDAYGHHILIDRFVTDPTKIAIRISKEKIKLEKLLAIQYENRMNSLAIGKYSQAERDSFAEKLASARDWNLKTSIVKDLEISDYLSDPNSYTNDNVIMFDEITFTGTISDKRAQVDTLASSIIQNNLAWRKLIGILTKDRKRMWTEINSVTIDESGLDYLLAYSLSWSV